MWLCKDNTLKRCTWKHDYARIKPRNINNLLYRVQGTFFKFLNKGFHSVLNRFNFWVIGRGEYKKRVVVDIPCNYLYIFNVWSVDYIQVSFSRQPSYTETQWYISFSQVSTPKLKLSNQPFPTGGGLWML